MRCFKFRWMSAMFLKASWKKKTIFSFLLFTCNPPPPVIIVLIFIDFKFSIEFRCSKHLGDFPERSYLMLTNFFPPHQCEFGLFNYLIKIKLFFVYFDQNFDSGFLQRSGPKSPFSPEENGPKIRSLIYVRSTGWFVTATDGVQQVVTHGRPP